tara:strand:- start:146 stop:655 length:510 start_codon:yes stop_codon:yes gene_type:complete
MIYAESIPAEPFLNSIQSVGFTDVVAVPDTHQRSLIDILSKHETPRFIQAATEDEAIAIAAGLIVGGRVPLVQIQHAGLYASVNHLRGIAEDGRFPMVLLIGLLSRDAELLPQEHGGSMVRLAQPLLDTFDIPHYLMEKEEDLNFIESAYQLAQEREGPVALLVGVATS